MNILFISYWAFHEGLTSSTVFPHLKLLAEFEEINQVVFTSIERDLSVTEFSLDFDKVIHIPLYSKGTTNVFLNKWHDFTTFPKKLIQYCKDYQIDKIICRGAPAGALGYLVWKKTKIPFIVESFEPHADYMLESGVWHKFDPRLLLQKYWEKKLKKFAQKLITVSENYYEKLLAEGIDKSKLDIIPCTVNLEKFAFKQEDRDNIRSKHLIDTDSTVGIYVGKFGGIYLDQEAFTVFLDVLSVFEKPVMIILTPDNPLDIQKKANIAGLNEKVQLIVLLTKHDEVPKYLSASDVAFATIKPAKSRKYCSAIKVGEYYASGLPTIITQGVGDDSSIIDNQSAGIVLDQNYQLDSNRLVEIIKNTPKSYYRKIAQKYRNPEIDLEVYKRIVL